MSKASPRILYVGARLVGRRCLEALLAADAQIAGLLYLDETEAEHTVAFTGFDDLIAAYHLPARAFRRLDTPEVIAWARHLESDVGMVVGVSQLIADALLHLPHQGFIGMHPTLLPEGRGRAPIPWALIKGLESTGVSLFWCSEQADDGPLLAQAPLPIHYEDTAATLGARADALAAHLLVSSLPALAAGNAPRILQNEAAATVWPRRRPEDGHIDWQQPGRYLYDFVRALAHPYPGAFTSCQGKQLFVWALRESGDLRRDVPGRIIDVLPHGVLVAAVDGCVLLTRLQWEGAEEQDAHLGGLQPGDQLGVPP